MATRQEQADLDAMKTERAKMLEQMFSTMSYLDRCNETALSHTGHKTREAAIRWTFQETEKRIRKLVEAHIRKYPD